METLEQPILPGFEAELRSLPAASRASRLPLPGSDEAQRMTVGSGRQLCTLLNKSGPYGQFLKTLLTSEMWTGSRQYFYSWTLSAMSTTALEFRLTPWAPTTLETDSLSSLETEERTLWSTPMSDDLSNRRRDGKERLEQGRQMNLSDQAKTPTLWPTPTSNPHHGKTNHEGSPNLAMFVTLWPTPHEADGLGGGRTPETWEKAKKESGGGCSNLRDAVKLWPSPIARDWKSTSPAKQATNSRPLSEVAGRTGVAGSLNPTFVEHLMGFPKNWTQLSPTGTPEISRHRSRKNGFQTAHLDLGL